MNRAPYRVQKMIQDLNRDPKAAEAFRADPEPTFDTYKLEPKERILIRDGSMQALCELGVQSNLQMKFRFFTGQLMGGGPPLANYLDRLLRY